MFYELYNSKYIFEFRNLKLYYEFYYLEVKNVVWITQFKNLKMYHGLYNLRYNHVEIHFEYIGVGSRNPYKRACSNRSSPTQSIAHIYKS